MSDLIQDISILTTIQRASLERVKEQALQCISHSVFENCLGSDQITTIDIGIGTLRIKVEEESIRYKFVPSAKLEKMVLSVVETGESPVTSNVEQQLTDRILKTYKDLL